ncbi:hypothetical protein BDQ17DRAFT_685076 [Cyathus striatus]|nr:hypothetical protein BDQ17DRAFT_685076 [Cyathus striatus]
MMFPSKALLLPLIPIHLLTKTCSQNLINLRKMAHQKYLKVPKNWSTIILKPYLHRLRHRHQRLNQKQRGLRYTRSFLSLNCYLHCRSMMDIWCVGFYLKMPSSEPGILRSLVGRSPRAICRTLSNTQQESQNSPILAARRKTTNSQSHPLYISGLCNALKVPSFHLSTQSGCSPSPRFVLYPLLFSDSLSLLEISDISPTAIHLVKSLLTVLPNEAPGIRQLVLRGPQQLSQIALYPISKLKHLMRLELDNITTIEGTSFLESLGTLPLLKI